MPKSPHPFRPQNGSDWRLAISDWRLATGQNDSDWRLATGQKRQRIATVGVAISHDRNQPRRENGSE
ncbi:MAG: hypothetical protein RRB24_05055 [Armatimonadota bacterium]|nr:hypothetical protein [Armatimonadota bacterium]MDT7972179.1 hypothetical protein [Armatimonadota bacterium]